jgi:hypothetical protein
VQLESIPTRQVANSGAPTKVRVKTSRRLETGTYFEKELPPIFSSSSAKMSVSPAVCTSAACVKAGAALLSYMAPNYTAIDPCTDWDTCT